jgi:hypothetical protein
MVSAAVLYCRSSHIYRPEPLLFLPGISSVILTRLSGPRFKPTATQKNLIALGIEPKTSESVARNSDH